MGAVKEHIRRTLMRKRVAPVITRVLRATHTVHMLPEYMLNRMPVPAVVPVRLPDGEYEMFVGTFTGDTASGAFALAIKWK